MQAEIFGEAHECLHVKIPLFSNEKKFNHLIIQDRAVRLDFRTELRRSTSCYLPCRPQSLVVA